MDFSRTNPGHTSITNFVCQTNETGGNFFLYSSEFKWIRLEDQHLFYGFCCRFYLVLELFDDVGHHPVIVVIQYVSLSKLEVTVEVS